MWYATGPCHAIQLANGRIIAPCNFSLPTSPTTSDKYSHVILSDDGGHTWSIGGIVGPGCNESTVVELPDGVLCLNSRNTTDKQCRYVCYSFDNGETLTGGRWDETLIEPQCQGSLINYDASPRVFFSNPASKLLRLHLTVRSSQDQCLTWPRSKVIFDGACGYSDMVVLPDGKIGILFERGVAPLSTFTIEFDVFDLAWFLSDAECRCICRRYIRRMVMNAVKKFRRWLSRKLF
jgi:sialidase-1